MNLDELRKQSAENRENLKQRIFGEMDDAIKARRNPKKDEPARRPGKYEQTKRWMPAPAKRAEWTVFNDGHNDAFFEPTDPAINKAFREDLENIRQAQHAKRREYEARLYNEALENAPARNPLNDTLREERFRMKGSKKLGEQFLRKLNDDARRERGERPASIEPPKPSEPSELQKKLDETRQFVIDTYGFDPMTEDPDEGMNEYIRKQLR